jgi:uncharacterized protein (TIGR02217 family)
MATDTSTSFEQFPDVPRTYQRTPRSDAMVSTKQNEFRDYNQLNDRIYYQYEVSMEVLSPSEQDKVERLFITHQGFSGSANNIRFHFQDPDDKTVNDVQFGTGDGVTTKFQLNNEYTFGGQTETFPQGHVEEGTLSVTNGGSNVSDSDIGVDYDAGTVEFDTAPADGNVLKATFDYFKLVQFANSEITAELNTPPRRNQSVELVEVAG